MPNVISYRAHTWALAVATIRLCSCIPMVTNVLLKHGICFMFCIGSASPNVDRASNISCTLVSQDALYVGLDPPDVVTAWLALTPSTVANGCLRVKLGSHQELLQHRVTDDKLNLLLKGQTIDLGEEVRNGDVHLVWFGIGDRVAIPAVVIAPDMQGEECLNMA